MIYAEADIRKNGSASAASIGYFNKIRERAYGNTSGDVSSLSLQNILDERMREFYWEGFRRTDLVRFNQFTTSTYLWPWKGNVASGTGVESFRNLFPIPSPELSSNSNLIQNTGY
jgi:hypothetical protein